MTRNAQYFAEYDRRRAVTPNDIARLPRVPGRQFMGVTPGGRSIPCTVADDGSLHADTHQVCEIVGWLP